MYSTSKLSKFPPNNLSLLTQKYREAKKSNQLLNSNKCKIYCISDLHLEFYQSHLTLWNDIKFHLPDADVLILAGDIGIPVDDGFYQYGQLLKMFKTRYSNIILVPGNHEFYRAKNYDLGFVFDNLKKLCEQCKIILLNNSSVVINNVKFIGTTLWSMIDPEAKINDIGRVFPDSVEYNEEFIKCKNWLKLELDTISEQSDNPIRCVVITHHLPTSELIHSKYIDSPVLNTAFSTDILEDMNLSKVDLWFCGHTHECKTYEHLNQSGTKTVFVANPYGYPHEVRDTFTTSDTFAINRS